MAGATLSDGEGPLLLQAYAGYVFFMSLNGITECFVAAVRDFGCWYCVSLLTGMSVAGKQPS